MGSSVCGRPPHGSSLADILKQQAEANVACDFRRHCDLQFPLRLAILSGWRTGVLVNIGSE